MHVDKKHMCMHAYVCVYPMVKVSGRGGGLSPLLPFEPPAII